MKIPKINEDWAPYLEAQKNKITWEDIIGGVMLAVLILAVLFLISLIAV